MSYDYYALDVNYDETYGQVEKLTGFAKAWMLKKGLIIGDEYPKDAQFQFAKTEGNLLTDFVNNIFRAVMISERFKDMLIELGVTEESAQFLPFTLLNKRGKPFNGTFYIVNPLEFVECLDLEKIAIAAEEDEDDEDDEDIFYYSGVQYNSALKEKILDVCYIILDPEKIPEDKLIFRIKDTPKTIILRSDIIEKIIELGLTGLSYQTTDGLGIETRQL